MRTQRICTHLVLGVDHFEELLLIIFYCCTCCFQHLFELTDIQPSDGCMAQLATLVLQWTMIAVDGDPVALCFGCPGASLAVFPYL